VTYTQLVLVATAVAVGTDLAVMRLLVRRAFWTAYGIVLFFQILANGWLTGRGIVRYDPAAIIGWRVAFAPVEDLLFGFVLVLWTLECWVWPGRSRARNGGPGRTPAARRPAA
jgi:lycopene cyclase domain-containing protein